MLTLLVIFPIIVSEVVMGGQIRRLLLFTGCFILSLYVSGETRPFLATGNWYPSDAGTLNRMLDGFFGNTKSVDVPGSVRGIISPHAGLIHSGPCSANAYQLVKNRKITRVILLGVSHRGGFSGACVSDYSFNETPLGKIPVDTVVTAKLAKEALFVQNNRIMHHEHSIENQLPFLQRILKGQDFKVVPILLGGGEFSRLKAIANIIGKYLDDQTLVVASTDFTHYGRNFQYEPFKKNIKERLTELDMGMINRIIRKDIRGFDLYKKRTGITMCGFKPVGVLMHLLIDPKYSVKLIDYYKSGDQNDRYDLSVSYASLVFYEKVTEMEKTKKLSKKEQKTLLSIARAALKHYFETGSLPEDPERGFDVSPELMRYSGVFVTLKKKGHLRGCIGSLVGQDPLVRGVVKNAMNAALRDPRFSPVTRNELAELSVEISVMTPLRKITDYRTIRLGVDGVIVRRGNQQAVYLPQVATETGWRLDQFLEHLCQKAGLNRRSYTLEGMEFFVFQAQVFGEE